MMNEEFVMGLVVGFLLLFGLWACLHAANQGMRCSYLQGVMINSTCVSSTVVIDLDKK